MIANAATSRDETSDPARAAQKRLDQRSIVEQRRVRLCYAVAASAPIIAATASFAILRMAWLIGGPRMMTTAGGKSFWRVYEWGIFPGNLLIGSIVALLAILFIYPEPGRRWRVGVAFFVTSPFVFILSYVIWERLWLAVR